MRRLSLARSYRMKHLVALSRLIPFFWFPRSSELWGTSTGRPRFPDVSHGVPAWKWSWAYDPRQQQFFFFLAAFSHKWLWRQDKVIFICCSRLKSHCGWLAVCFLGQTLHNQRDSSCNLFAIRFYSRSAADSFCPPTRAIRARQYVAAHQIMQDGHGLASARHQRVERAREQT